MKWIDVYLDKTVDGKIPVTGFSMTNAPALTTQSGVIDLAIKETGEHPVTNWITHQVQIGDKIRLCGGQGNFYFTKEIAYSYNLREVVFIGGGIGGTEIKSNII